MTARRARGGVSAMSGAGSLATIENEIERAREEGNWKRVIQLAEQLRGRAQEGARPQFETLGSFLIGEAKLEDFLEEYPPKDKNISAAKDGLQGAQEHLMRTIGEEAKKLGVHLDSYILLGKLNYAMGNYTEALRYGKERDGSFVYSSHLSSAGFTRGLSWTLWRRNSFQPEV